jgi:hypothetical protein
MNVIEAFYQAVKMSRITVRGDIGVDRTWEGVNRTVEESSVNSGQWLGSLRTGTSVGNYSVFCLSTLDHLCFNLSSLLSLD